MFQELKNIFEEILQAENDNLVDICSHNYKGNYLKNAFLESDEKIVNLISIIETKIKDDKFKNYLTSLERAKYKNEVKIREEEIKYNPSFRNISFLKTYKERLDNLSFDSMMNNFLSDAEIDSEITTTNLKEKYPFFCLLKLLFDAFKMNKRFDFEKENNLTKFYRDNKIDLNLKNQYELIKIDDNFEIIPNNSLSYILDNKLSVYISLREISYEVLVLLNKLKVKNIITDLFLRPDYSTPMKSLCMMEELERGNIFSFDGLKSPEVSKLFSVDNYKNCLWINIDGKNITFEELCDDFDNHGESIITQVVHLEYKGNFINHIDHEYIFYTADEYDKRCTDYKQQGKKFKTFKVDNSSIPFTLENGDFFLYRILDGYFKHKDLLIEYFQNVLKTTE